MNATCIPRPDTPEKLTRMGEIKWEFHCRFISIWTEARWSWAEASQTNSHDFTKADPKKCARVHSHENMKSDLRGFWR